MGSWLRNDILVLFIELFRVHINQRSASRHFPFELIKARYSFAFNLLSWKQTKLFVPSPLLFFFPFCLYAQGRGTSHGTQCQCFLSRGVEPAAPRCGARGPSVSAGPWLRPGAPDAGAWGRAVPGAAAGALRGGGGVVHSTELGSS